jgi:hypothetical protein
MAKTWTMRETYEVLKEGNAKARQELGKRFPLVSTATIEEIMACLPDSLTARKVETALAKYHNLKGEEVEKESEETVAPLEEKKVRTRKAKEPVEEKKTRTRKVKEIKPYTEEELSVMSDDDIIKVGKEVGLYEDGIEIDSLFNLVADFMEKKAKEAAALKRTRKPKEPVEEKKDDDFEQFEDFE